MPVVFVGMKIGHQKSDGRNEMPEDVWVNKSGDVYHVTYECALRCGRRTKQVPTKVSLEEALKMKGRYGWWRKRCLRCFHK